MFLIWENITSHRLFLSILNGEHASSRQISCKKRISMYSNIRRIFSSNRDMEDMEKSVVPVLFLFCVALWFILRGASCFKVFPCSLSSCFVIPSALWSPRLGKRELVYVLLVHLFVCFVRVSFCHFSSWCRGLAAVCDCGTPWIFLLTF